MSRIHSRPHVSHLLITALAGCAALTTGCTGPTRAQHIAKPEPTPIVEQAVAEPPQDPMLLTLHGALANTHVLAARPGEVIARLRIDSQPHPRDERPPVNLALAIDTSGSMEGAAIEHARDAAAKLLDELEPGDRLSLVVFHSTAEVLVPSTEITADNKAELAARIATMKAMGTTDMASGMSLAIQELVTNANQEQISRLVLLSDGVPNDGTNIVNLSRSAHQHGIAITALGLGIDYDETLLANVAQNSGGTFHYVEEPSLVASVFHEEVLRLERVVARNMSLTISPGPGVTIQEVMGVPMQRQGPRAVSVQLGDHSVGEPRDLLVRMHVDSRREGATVELFDGVLHFVDAVDNAGRFERRVFLAARATSDASALESGRNLEIEEAVESARAAVATVMAVASARAGNLVEAHRILDSAEPAARQAAARYDNDKLIAQADEMKRLRAALPTVAPNGPVNRARNPAVEPDRRVPSAIAEDAPSVDIQTAPATVRAVHGSAMKTLQGR